MEPGYGRRKTQEDLEVSRQFWDVGSLGVRLPLVRPTPSACEIGSADLLRRVSHDGIELRGLRPRGRAPAQALRRLPPAERQRGAALRVEIDRRREGRSPVLYGPGARASQAVGSQRPGAAGQLHTVSQFHGGIDRLGPEMLGMPQEALASKERGDGDLLT